jgi:hypothetical protein
MTSPTPEFTATDDMAQRLLDSWHEYLDADVITTKGKTLPQVAVGVGLAMHTHRLAGPAFQLLRNEQVLESVPLVRSMFEAAVTAHWAVQVSDATNGFFHKQNRERRKLWESMAAMKLAHFGPDEYVKAVEMLDAQGTPTDAPEAHFKAICDDLEPREMHLYAQYRLMSQLSHPTDLLLDHYFATADGPTSVPRRSPPTQPDRPSMAAFALASLVWAGQAVEYANPSRSRRALLRQAAKTIGITPTLRPSTAVFLRRRNGQRQRPQPG